MSRTPPRSEADQFAVFYREHYQPVLAYGRRRSSADPEALAANVFALAWKKFEVARTLGLPWLYKTARFELSSEQRTATRNRTLSQTRQPHGDVESPEDRTTEGLWVQSLLDRLPENDRELLRLLYWEDLDHRQAALAMGCSVGTLAVRAHRARKKFLALVENDPITQHQTSVDNRVATLRADVHE